MERRQEEGTRGEKRGNKGKMCFVFFSECRVHHKESGFASFFAFSVPLSLACIVLIAKPQVSWHYPSQSSPKLSEQNTCSSSTVQKPQLSLAGKP